MTTILAGNPATFSVTLLQDGNPLSVSGDVQARVFTLDGRKELIPAFALTPGDDWAEGVIAIDLTADQTALLSPGSALLVLAGTFGVKRFRLVVETLFEATRTSLFVKDIVVDEIRKDRLMAAAAGVLQDVRVSDAYLWEKVRAAESEVAHTLRVPLVPTHFFPLKPTAEQIAALDGMAWDIDPPYDYEPGMFTGDKWGYIVTRQRPIIAVDRLTFSHPAANGNYLDIPTDWIRIDARYGHVRLVPSSPAVFMSMTGFTMNIMVSGRSVPFMCQLEYSAGLTDVETTYPELLDLIKKKAVLKIVQDAFLPSSGSISADGLSESISVDMSSYHDTIDTILNGPEGGNGGLMTKIHGIRLGVM